MHFSLLQKVWGGAVLGRGTVLCTALCQSWITPQGQWEIFPGKKTHQKEQPEGVLPGQGLCLAWGVPGSAQLLWWLLHRLLGTELSWDVVTAQISSASSALLSCWGLQR